jgi:hypothetical protein
MNNREFQLDYNPPASLRVVPIVSRAAACGKLGTGRFELVSDGDDDELSDDFKNVRECE